MPAAVPEKIVCECRDGCACATNPGPAVYLIIRDAKEIKVCTRCTLPDDQRIRILKENPVSAEEIMQYDPFGFICISAGGEES